MVPIAILSGGAAIAGKAVASKGRVIARTRWLRRGWDGFRADSGVFIQSPRRLRADFPRLGKEVERVASFVTTHEVLLSCVAEPRA